MLRVRLLVVCLTLMALVARHVVEAVCTRPRIRKSYDRMTVPEKLLFRRALRLSMERGLYIKFVEMHTERMSEMEAHRMCMFIYWHRYFLLGFENMLRSLGPEYECITVPYWDEMLHNTRSMAGSCRFMEDCSPVVRDWGGSTSGTQRSVVINGATVSGNICVDRSPLNSFCESSSHSGASCARCVPRGFLRSQVFPASTSFASVYRQLFTPTNIVDTTRSIEEGMHNAIHASIGGAMATFQSPSDPLFWAHHAYVDLLMAIHLKCRVGLGVLTPEQKREHDQAFMQCPRRGGGFFDADSTVTMRYGERGIDPVQVSQPNQELYEYFRDIPNRYHELSDVTQLGRSRYAYQLVGHVARMYVFCEEATSALRRLTAQYNFATNGTEESASTAPVTERPSCTTAPKPTDPPEEPPVSIIVEDFGKDEDTKKMDEWTHEVREALEKQREDKGEPPKPEEHIFEMEKMVCMFHDECRGGVHDYPEVFKKAFMIKGPPPCKRVVDQIKSTPCKKIKLDNWKPMMEKYFPCQLPNTTYPEEPDCGHQQ